jgi:hypothetical protein
LVLRRRSNTNHSGSIYASAILRSKTSRTPTPQHVLLPTAVVGTNNNMLAFTTGTSIAASSYYHYYHHCP